MPRRETPKPASVLDLGDPRSGRSASSPRPPNLTGGPSPDNANRVSNPDEAFSILGRAAQNAAKSLETSEENQKIRRKRKEGERLQGAAEARADRKEGRINRWQFANSENYRNETASLLVGHYGARLEVVQAEINRSSDPEYVKEQAAYLKALKADYDKQAQGIFAEDVEQDSVVLAGRASFSKTIAAVQDRLKILGSEYLGRIVDDIELNENLNAEQRHEQIAQSIEVMVDEFYLDETAANAKLADLNSANDAKLREEQAEARKITIEREKIVVKDHMVRNRRDAEVAASGIFEVGADGEIATNGNFLTQFIVKVNERAEATQPATDERGLPIDEPYYTEPAINKFAAEIITEALVSFVSNNGKGGVEDTIISQQYEWHEEIKNDDGSTEIVKFLLKPSIIDKIRTADKKFAGNQLKKIGKDSKTILKEANRPFDFHPAESAEGQAQINLFDSFGELGSSKGIALTIRQTHSYRVALEQENIQSETDALEFAEKIRDGSAIDYIDAVDAADEAKKRRFLAEEFIDGIDKMRGEATNEYFTFITGKPYPLEREGFPDAQRIRGAINNLNADNADLETGTRHRETLALVEAGYAELTAHGFPIPKKKLKQMITIANKGEGKEVIENIQSLLENSFQQAASNYGGSDRNIARGKAETLRGVREDNKNYNRIWLAESVNGSSGQLQADIDSYRQELPELKEEEEEDIVAARRDAKGLDFANFDIDALTSDDNPEWSLDPRVKEFLNESILRDIHRGKLREGRDYTITEGNELELNYDAANMKETMNTFYNGVQPLDESPYEMRFFQGKVDAVPKMTLPGGVNDPGGRLRAQAIRNFIFADTNLQGSLLYQSWIEEIGLGAQEEIDRFIVSSGRTRGTTLASEMTIIPSEAGVQITYPTIKSAGRLGTTEGTAIFPYILPWELFDVGFYEEAGNP